MKQLFLGMTAFVAVSTTTAFAADLAVKSPRPAPMPAPAIFNWTGCYIGVEGGGNWGRSEQISRSGITAGLPITGGFDLSGGLAGGTVGCNYQIGSFVIGIENDYSWTNKQGSAFDQPPFNTAVTSATREKWVDTLRGRAGFAWDRIFLYGTGGGAWAGTEVNIFNPVLGSVIDSRTRTG